MALSVATLAGFPAANSALANPVNGTPVDAATYTYTPQASTVQVEDLGSTSIYSPTPGTVFVAGILDLPSVQPGRIFPAMNTGSNTTAVSLPTLVSVTLVNQTGGSIQEFGATTTQTSVPGRFIVLLTPFAGGIDDGVFPLGYVGPVAWTTQGGAYSNANPSTGYPQPVQKFEVSLSAMLIIASTQYG